MALPLHGRDRGSNPQRPESENMDDTVLDNKLAVRDCEHCPKLVECRSQIVNGVGPVDAAIVFVGEAPGATEDDEGEPFIGRSGQILTEALSDRGIDREDVRITNCVRCRPPKNRDPNKTELANCSDHLDEELTRISPRVVVPLGRIPVQHILGDVGQITEVAGSVHEIEINGSPVTVVASVHPAATLYNRSLEPTFNETFDTISQLAGE